MPFYEVIFEDGSHSICDYADDDEALVALNAHHERALGGEAAQEGLDRPAGRIAKVLVYESHPVEYEPEVTVAAMQDAIEGAENPMAAAAAIRDLASPVVASPPHDSNYAAPESRELAWEV